MRKIPAFALATAIRNPFARTRAIVGTVAGVRRRTLRIGIAPGSATGY